MKSLTVLLASLFLIVAGANAQDASPQSGQSSNIVTKDNFVIVGLASGSMHSITVLNIETMEVYAVKYQEKAPINLTKATDWVYRSLKDVKEAEVKKTQGKK